MKSNTTSILIQKYILLLFPLVLYGVFKNGYLLYQKGLVSFLEVFKPIYLLLISIILKIIIDLIRYKKIKYDYDLFMLIIVSMIVPYNISYLVFTISILLTYLLSILLEKKFKFNKVCFMFLIIMFISFILKNYSFRTPLDLNYSFNFSFIDYLMGRTNGGISSTSIFFSLIAFIFLLNDFYYKKKIPLIMLSIYLLTTFIYYIITNNSILIMNGDFVFASIFIATIPLYSPYSMKNQVIYS